MLKFAVFLASLFVIAVHYVHAQTDQTLGIDFQSINTPYDEQSPALAPDGNTLYVTIANHELNVGGKSDPGDIWVSTKTETGWSAPVHGGSTLNSRWYNAVAGFSVDGKQIFLVNHYTENGEAPQTQGFAVAYKTSSGWTAPQNIYIPYFLNRSPLISGTIRDDVFIFSAESYSSFGAEDLYISFKNGSNWTEPRNLGRVLNTSFQELSPWLSADKRTLYFASNNPKGFGSFDIYFSTRLDDNWTAWSKPENLGSTVNSEGRELFFRKLENGVSIFTSTRNSDGYGDIRSYQAPADSSNAQTPTADSVIVTTSTATTVSVYGRVLNAKSNEPVSSAKIIFKSEIKLEVMSMEAGNYAIALPPQKIYVIEIHAPGFINTLERLELNTLELPTVELNFKLIPIEVGALVNLKSVLFEVGSTTLLSESYDELNVVVDFLKSNPRVEIELEGHTDFRGDAKKNMKLSQLRVEQVKNYLISKGISGKRIKGKGFGGQRPIANSDTEEARKMNRRVEFMITRN